MQQFIENYRDQIHGSLTGFDRLVFRGSLRQLNFVKPDKGVMVAAGMENYLWQNEIRFKDYQDHVKSVSERVKKASLAPLEKQQLPVIWLSSPTEDKSQSGAPDRGRKKGDQRTGMRDQRHGAESDVRAPEDAHDSTDAALPRAVSLPDRPRSEEH